MSSPSANPILSSFPFENIYGMEKLPKEIRNLLAGGIAGMVAKSIVAPIDRIKILYQVTSIRFYLRDIPKVANIIVQKEGLCALWKGNIATMIRVFPYSGIQFMVFDRCKFFFLSRNELLTTNNSGRFRNKWGLSPLQSLMAGSFAGALSVICTYPLDLIRAQLAVLKTTKNEKKNRTKGFLDVLMINYRKGGAGGLFRGITPTLVGILPYSGIAFTINEQAKRQIYHITGRDPSTVERMQCGAVSGLFAQSMTYPLEVTRRRMQTIGIVTMKGEHGVISIFENGTLTNNSKNGNKKIILSTKILNQSRSHINKKLPSTLKTMEEILKEQGFRGFFKGVSMNWLKGPLAFSISFTVFDIMQNLMETKEERTISPILHG